MPGDLSDGSLDRVGVLEDHNRLGGDVLGKMLGLLSLEIFLEEIDLVVLENALFGSSSKVFGGLCETKVGISVESLHVFGDISGLGVIVVLGPS